MFGRRGPAKVAKAAKVLQPSFPVKIVEQIPRYPQRHHCERLAGKSRDFQRPVTRVVIECERQG
jgi:hypothetical protein